MEDSAGLDRLLRELDRASEIAVDTEADSFYSYRERVCLIQVTALGVDYLVDPLRELDLGPLGEVLADPARTKVFHDGEYDVLILKQDFGFRFGGLFDTRVAAAALGLEFPGLASVVEERFGIKLDKSQQRSDWSRRPLTGSQIDYARQDTRYLIPLMHQMRAELERRERLQIVESECRRLEGLEPSPKWFEPDEFLRIKGARSLSPKGMRVLRELYVWRDGEAERRNVPPFKVLGNKPMLELAQRAPRSLRALEGVEGFSARLASRLGKAVLDVVKRAEDLGPLAKLPELPPKDGLARLGDVETELHERLKAWRRKEAEARGMDSSLVLNRHVLHRLADRRPASDEDLRGVEGLADWQLEELGAALLGLVRRFEADLAAGRVELGGRRRRSR